MGCMWRRFDSAYPDQNMKQNDFGPLSAEYHSARRGYPEEVYQYLKTLVPNDQVMVLDLGCGTGISSQELKAAGFLVTGADKDTGMLQVAKNADSSITYIAATADSLPFADDSFDAVTAFTSFHWFNDEVSLHEINRVLKPGGIFFAALKGNRGADESPEFRNDYRNLLMRYAGEDFDKTKLHFEHSIVKSTFSSITTAEFPVDEKYTIEESLTLLRSLSSWNLIPEIKRDEYLAEARHLFERHFGEGPVVRKRLISVVVGRK